MKTYPKCTHPTCDVVAIYGMYHCTQHIEREEWESYKNRYEISPRHSMVAVAGHNVAFPVDVPVYVRSRDLPALSFEGRGWFFQRWQSPFYSTRREALDDRLADIDRERTRVLAMITEEG